MKWVHENRVRINKVKNVLLSANSSSVKEKDQPFTGEHTGKDHSQALQRQNITKNKQQQTEKNLDAADGCLSEWQSFLKTL